MREVGQELPDLVQNLHHRATLVTCLQPWLSFLLCTGAGSKSEQ